MPRFFASPSVISLALPEMCLHDFLWYFFPLFVTKTFVESLGAVGFGGECGSCCIGIATPGESAISADAIAASIAFLRSMFGS
jgi:hypothetical protein